MGAMALKRSADTFSDSQSNSSNRNHEKMPHQFAFQAPPTTERSFYLTGNETELMESTFLYDPFEVPDSTAILFTVRVLYDYNSQAREELDIKKDQLIPVTATHEDGWWEGLGMEHGRKRKGLFPSNFTEHIQ
jgi:hypothetical protein